MKDEMYNIDLPSDQDIYAVLRIEGENAVYYDHWNDEEFTEPLTENQLEDIKHGENIELRLYPLKKRPCKE
ncbi:MAG TPA: hypothetical protein DCO67_02135 [Staphylococcus sp.]|uniref:hypothetical protein n=1 Tax=Mammaliicoccus TaxID=2803850 RepID=UPI000ECEE6D7|nr:MULTISPECIES: hypothetical protein [Mammaliicoccus]HAL08747.1 hypothetical protein [Staphylococcus sp.]